MSPAGLFTIARVVPAAVLAVAGASKLRRHRPEDEPRDDLFHAPVGEDLVQLDRKQLRRLVQEGAPLDDVVLRRASMRGVDLSDRDLSGRDLRHADLCRARLGRVSFAGADLRFADLRGADLRDASLASARLLEADLGGADLRGADLSGVQNLGMARLQGARADAATVWPGSFDPAAAGVRRVDR
jgi:uncharacterized protein YjbI with pentapeptide repeats